MKVSDILRVKGNTLFTVSPDEPLSQAIDAMAEKDIGSLVVMNHGDLVGMLTFREVIQCIVRNGHVVGAATVRSAMDDHPTTCTLETELDLKVRYLTQTGIRPPTFVLFKDSTKAMHFSHERYVANQLRKEFGFAGTPIVIKSKSKNSKRSPGKRQAGAGRKKKLQPGGPVTDS